LFAGVLPISKGCCVSLYLVMFSTVLIRIGKIEVRFKFVSDDATKVHNGSRYYSSTIFNLGSRWTPVVNYMIQENCEDNREYELM